MPSKPLLDADNIHAVVTTRWNNGAYKPYNITSIESYTIETNLDEDSDPFNIVIGDRTGEFAEMLRRDNEVRIQIFGIGEGVTYLMTGIMDSVVYSDTGTYVCAGRDLSCVATDTLAEPVVYRHQRASDIIIKRAKDLKCAPRWDLMPTNILGKIATDGSETEWEFWYRFIRRAAQWMWYEPDGTLRSGKLAYADPATYFLGDPKNGTNASQWIPVERAEFHSSKQQRVAEATIFYNDQHRLLPIKEPDPTIQAWIRKPKKFFEQKDIVKRPAAVHFIKEEIFESQVGAQEIKLIIPDPGTLIRQNTIATLNVPNLSLEGDWFICGTRIIADESGFTQEVRLREKNFGISRRVPKDPPTSQEPGKTTTDELAKDLQIPNHPEWSQFFINSAREFHGQYEFEWFLAVLLGICDQETGGSFTNVRNNSGPGVHHVEWFDWDKTTAGPQHGIKNLAEWELSFSNEPSGVAGMTLAVGPMQLYTYEFKVWADQALGGGPVSELRGNRWNPENNIWISGKVLKGKCEGLPGENAGIWKGVAAYGEGTGYAKSVQAKVEGEEGYYAQVKEAFLEAALSARENAGDVAEAVSGDSQEIAKEIIKYYNMNPPRYRDDTGGNDIAQIRLIAAGKRVDSPSCEKAGMVELSPQLLGTLKFLMDKGYWIGTFALCTDHQHLGCGSRHAWGMAADISSIGTPETGWANMESGGKTAKTLVMEVMTILKAQKKGVYKPRQMIMNGIGHYDKTVQALQLNNWEPDSYVDGDHTDHLHIGMD